MPRRQIITPIGPSIAYIPLTNNQFALIDSDLIEFLPKISWQAEWNECTRSFYAVGHLTVMGARQKKIRLHRHVLGFPSCVDHKNHNTLDCRKINLRSATRAQNCQNARQFRGKVPQFKGVGFYTRDKNWRARIQVNGKQIVLGYFKTPELASEAYQKAALKYHGEFAHF